MSNDEGRDLLELLLQRAEAWAASNLANVIQQRRLLDLDGEVGIRDGCDGELAERYPNTHRNCIQTPGACLSLMLR